MGIAAYNRGSRAIREQIDRDMDRIYRRTVHEVVRTHEHDCERCGSPLGVRLNRGCTWDARRRVWVDACRPCQRVIVRENRDVA